MLTWEFTCPLQVPANSWFFGVVNKEPAASGWAGGTKAGLFRIFRQEMQRREGERGGREERERTMTGS